MKEDKKISEKRWKPKNDEKFWYVDNGNIQCCFWRILYDYCTNTRLDLGLRQHILWKAGNCFRTKSIALKAMKLSKKTLIQFGKENN